MISISIPGLGNANLKYLVCDFSGTLSIDGKIIPGVLERINKLSEDLDIFIVTADTHGRAEKELLGFNCSLTFIKPENEHLQKESFIVDLGAENVIAIGNGMNDRKMLRAAKIGIAICLNEGLSMRSAISANIISTSIIDALDMILKPDRMKATLRF